MAFRQETVFAASTDRVFKILTDGAAFAAATGAPAAIDPRPGGAFACFGEQITGRFVEIVPAERVVQAWRVAAWPAGVYSIACFTLAGDHEQTTLTLDHAAYPEEAEAHLQTGWGTMYWEPFKTHLSIDSSSTSENPEPAFSRWMPPQSDIGACFPIAGNRLIAIEWLLADGRDR